MAFVFPEANLWKTIYLSNIGVAFLVALLLLLSPAHNQLAEFYLYMMLAGMALVGLDILLFGFPFSELFFDTITVDEDPSPVGEKKFFFQNFFPMKHILVFSVLAGIVLGSFYAYSIVVEKTAYIAVPRLFASAPVSFSAKAFDAWGSSFIVANAEELVWTGFMFPLIWGALAAFAFLYVKGSRGSVFLVTMIVAALLSGWLAAWVFHSFVYQGNLYAYASGQFHFTATALLAGATGSIVGGVIAHYLHNAIAILQYQSGYFQVVPFQVYAGEEAGRVFPT